MTIFKVAARKPGHDGSTCNFVKKLRYRHTFNSKTHVFKSGKTMVHSLLTCDIDVITKLKVAGKNQYKPEILETLPKVQISTRFQRQNQRFQGWEQNCAISTNAQHRYHHDFQDGGQTTSINRKYL